MTKREESIMDAANSHYTRNDTDIMVIDDLRGAFEEGAKWADEHPENQDFYDICAREHVALVRESFILQQKLAIAITALEASANEDYRGNRSSESVRSFQALEKIKSLSLNDERSSEVV